jgi:hypothetical protein
MRTERELKDKLTEIEMKLLYHRFDDLEYLHTLQEQYSFLEWVLGDAE